MNKETEEKDLRFFVIWLHDRSTNFRRFLLDLYRFMIFTHSQSKSMICYIGSSPQVGVNKFSSKSYQSKSTSQKLLPSSATNDLLQMTPKKIGFQEHVYHCLSSYLIGFLTQKSRPCALLRWDPRVNPVPWAACVLWWIGEKRWNVLNRWAPVGLPSTTSNSTLVHSDLRISVCGTVMV